MEVVICRIFVVVNCMVNILMLFKVVYECVNEGFCIFMFLILNELCKGGVDWMFETVILLLERVVGVFIDGIVGEVDLFDVVGFVFRDFGFDEVIIFVLFKCVFEWLRCDFLYCVEKFGVRVIIII